ncbi:MAG: metallophosphoesterase [Pseudomonadota bacterium]
MIKMIPVLLALLWVLSPGWAEAAASVPDRPFGIALIGDPHLPGKNLPTKEEVIRTIDGWDDIDRVVVLGDICKETGTAAEYAVAKKFFGSLHQPTRLIAGNHDYIYEDEMNSEGRKVKASPTIRRMKLARFAETFGMKAVYGEERLGNYLLIYLSTDDLETGHLAQLSEDRVAWLSAVLSRNRNLPTIIFFHAPLAGTLKTYNERVNTPSFVAQPAIRLHGLIRENPQIFLWVSGHLHVPATNESYSSPVNVYEKQVTVIHNADLERKRPWTNVLYLYPERVVVRTYDHWQKSWRPDLERTIRNTAFPDR